MNQGLSARLGMVLGDLGRRDIAPAALAAAKSRIFHACGVSLASSRLAPALAAWASVQDGSGEGFVFGQSRRIAPADAAFVNGVIGHSSLLEDCGPGGLREGSHPGTYIIPAALAAAQAQRADGRRFLAGLVVGYEAVSRIGAAAPAAIVSRRFRPLGVMGPFGAAAGAATVLGADDRQLAAALAIAANLSAGTTQGIFEGSMEPYFQAGLAARNGIFAARLGLSGATTASQAFEGSFGFFQTYAGEAADGLAMLAPSARCGIEQVGTKRFAACLQNQHTLALIVDGIAEPLAQEAIERVTVTRPESGTHGLNSPGVSRSAPPDNMLSAQMSARFTVAAALMGLPVDDPMFFQRSFGDPKIAALTQRIDLVPAKDDRVTVSVLLRSGQTVHLENAGLKVLFPDAAAVRAKFLKRAEPVIGRKAEDAAALIDDLENLGDIRALTEALRGA
jgi:2-methylcitrate dehydratase PrpD